MYVAQLNKLLYERLTVGFALRRSKLVQETHVTLAADRKKKKPIVTPLLAFFFTPGTVLLPVVPLSFYPLPEL